LIEVFRVDRPEPDKKAVRVVIGAGAIAIHFVLTDGAVIEEARIKLYAGRICDDQTLWVSPADYRLARQRAVAILQEKKSVPEGALKLF
jgi:hypothetical protein